MEKEVDSRRKAYEKKRENLNAYCTTRCRPLMRTPPSPERCDSCTIGRKLRLIEVEYSDVTGWSHSKWKN